LKHSFPTLLLSIEIDSEKKLLRFAKNDARASYLWPGAMQFISNPSGFRKVKL